MFRAEPTSRTFGAKRQELSKDKPMLKPLEFIRQVRTEMQKVTWPSMGETRQSTIAVFVMVFLASIFMYFADQIMAKLVSLVLGLGT